MSTNSNFYATKKARKYWSRWYLKKAWKSIKLNQLDDERRYFEAVLGFNSLRLAYLQRADESGHANSAKDLMYGYWTEEDLRLRVAAELMKFTNCQVHGQVHIRGRRNAKPSGRMPKHSHIGKYPDLMLLLFKERNVSGIAREGNLESAAIEIKSFLGWNKKWMKYAICRDLDKLVDYQKKRLTPRIDAGYFLCLDENNVALAILKELFKKRKYRKYKLGYGVIEPRYSLLGIPYPSHFEKYKGWLHRSEERKAAYIAHYLMAKLTDRINFTEVRKNDERCIKIYNDKWIWQGVVDIGVPEEIEGRGKKYLHVTFSCRKSKKDRLKDLSLWKWHKKYNTWHLRPRRPTDKGMVSALVCRINKYKLTNLDAIEDHADDVVKKVRRIVRRFM